MEKDLLSATVKLPVSISLDTKATKTLIVATLTIVFVILLVRLF